VRRGIVLAIGGLALLAGCKSQKENAYTMHLTKWQGTPYHIAFDAQAAKPSPAGIAIPDVKYTANPDALERRACLVVRFDPPQGAKDQSMLNQVIMGPVDITGAQGALPADYMSDADKSLAQLLSAYHLKGKVKVSVLLARPLLSQAGESDIQANRLSDWLQTDLVFNAPRSRR
jgi:hypothetical protein